MTMLLNLSVEPARRVFEVSVTMGASPAVRCLRVLAATPGGAARIVRLRYPRAHSPRVRQCPDSVPPALL